MTHYSIISTKNHYGVKVTKEKHLENITTDYSAIKFLVDCCNRFAVDFDHFEDVLENFIEDYKTF